MNLSGDQEKFVKMVSQAAGEWRESLGPIAWLLLGLWLLLGAAASVATWRWLRRGGLEAHRRFTGAKRSEQ